MKKIGIILILFVCFSMNVCFRQDSLTTLFPSVGFNNIRLGETTFEQLILTYGQDFQIDTNYYRIISNPIDLDTIIPYKSIYSIKMTYKKEGITFFFDPTMKKLFSIYVYPPFKAITDKGIILNESTFRDVEKNYGLEDWSFSSKKMHKHYFGISFHRKFHRKLPISGNQLLKYLDKKVTSISIEIKR